MEKNDPTKLNNLLHLKSFLTDMMAVTLCNNVGSQV